MESLILVGGGGHCKSVLDSIRTSNKFNVVGILDLNENVGSFIDGVQVIGTDEDYKKLYIEGIKNAFITVGSIKSTELRERIYNKLKLIGFKLPVIIDSSAIVSKNVQIGQGTFIAKGAIVNSSSKIGHNCIVNTGSIIEHDCNIGDFCHIAPGSTLSGGVKMGKGSLIGTNSTIIQGIEIGSNTVIGAGSVVVKNIKNNTIAYGNPCREVR
jgi:sugar O-acyltransferase (sialic acid O-acetyltransferase NeuD family)